MNQKFKFPHSTMKIRSLKKEIVIHAAQEDVFSFMDDLSKTGMHMSEKSMMMMGSKLALEHLSGPARGVGAVYHWHGKVMGMRIDITEKITTWIENREKIWETIGRPKIILLGWYRMILKTSAVKEGTLTSLQIDFTPPEGFFYRILYSLFSGWYCNWCLTNMLNVKIAPADKSLAS